jgi:mannan endo-1,4-beta-mannosidase
MKKKAMCAILAIVVMVGIVGAQGFTVSGTQLIAAGGKPFIQKGFAIPLAWFISDVNGNIANMKKVTNANCLRIVMNESTTDANWHSCVEQCIANKIIPEVEIHDVTCGTDANALNNVAKWWVGKASYVTQANIAKYILINIANEWGDWAMAKNNPTTWRDAYKTAVATMRSGGINTTLVIDAPDCGQDLTNGATLKSYAMDVFNSDTKKNCLFTVHLYGEWCKGGSSPTVGLPAIKNAGIPFIVGEFAAQSSAGTLDAASVISTCETNKIGWMAWSWKGNSEPIIDMSSDWAGANLTSWGKTAVTGTYGTKTAVTCTAFSTDIQSPFSETAQVAGSDARVTFQSMNNGVINVALHGLSGATTVKIFNSNGKLIQEQNAMDRKFFQISTHGGQGVYFIKVVNAQKTFAEKIFLR